MVSKDSGRNGFGTVITILPARARVTFIVKMYKPIIIIAHWSIPRNIIIGRRAASRYFRSAYTRATLVRRTRCPLIIPFLAVEKNIKKHKE